MSPKRRDRGAKSRPRAATLDRGAGAAPRAAVRWRAILIAATGVLVYWSALPAPFLFDDQTSLLTNGSIRELWPLSTPLSPPRETPVAGRPIVNLSFAVNYAIHALDPAGFRLVNLAIHVLAALTLFGVVRRSLASPRLGGRFPGASLPLAWTSALVWLLHPLHTEAVNYLSQRTELLMGLFYLLTLSCSIRGWSGLAVAACAVGMACKESMVTAPVMVVLYDRVFVFDSLRAACRARRGLYVGLAATWLVLAALMLSTPRTSVGFGGGTSAWVYVLNQAQVIVRYLWLTVWPRALVLDYGLPQPLTLGDVLPQAALVVGLGLMVLAALARRPMLGFLGAWFFITLAPTSSIVPIATEVGAERRMYLPLAGLVVLAAVGGYVGLKWLSSSWRGPCQVRAGEPDKARPTEAEPREGRPWHVAVAVVVCLLLATGTVLRNREYASRLSIARTIVDRWPSGRGHFLLGSELVAAGRREEAMVQFRASARDYPGARFAIATELAADGRFAEAVVELDAFLEALPAHPAAPAARDLRGQALLAQGRLDEAVAQFERLLERHPDYPAGDAVRRLIDQARRASQPPAAP
ncbi:MAG: tetratricopeptide repeat protein [Acidobacteria bacterium]|nr:tetratricopeptide repeat protein [Acidobacteriota bacterium]